MKKKLNCRFTYLHNEYLVTYRFNDDVIIVKYNIINANFFIVSSNCLILMEVLSDQELDTGSKIQEA